MVFFCNKIKLEKISEIIYIGKPKQLLFKSNYGKAFAYTKISI